MNDSDNELSGGDSRGVESAPHGRQGERRGVSECVRAFETDKSGLTTVSRPSPSAQLSEIVRQARWEFERRTCDGKVYDPEIFTQVVTLACQYLQAEADQKRLVAKARRLADLLRRDYWAQTPLDVAEAVDELLSDEAMKQ
jgi:hypothetical protein